MSICVQFTILVASAGLYECEKRTQGARNHQNLIRNAKSTCLMCKRGLLVQLQYFSAQIPPLL